MEIVFKSGALDDIEFWKRTGKTIIQNRITALLLSITSTPENSIGKPERLKGNLSGFWSRRINKIHRIVYVIDPVSQIVTIYSLKDHYKKL
jgi:toxin YoeB